MKEMETVSMSVGLTMNKGKIKYMVENIKEPEGIVSVGGKSIELVEDLYGGGCNGQEEEGLNVM